MVGLLVVLLGFACITSLDLSASRNKLQASLTDSSSGGLPLHTPRPKPQRLAYRMHLEENHSPHAYSIDDSSTLGFDHIYVVSVASAVQRRAQITKVAEAHGLNFQMFDAVAKDLPVIDWIADRVVETRETRRPILASKLGLPPDRIGGGAPDSIWLQDNQPADGFDFPASQDGRWQINGQQLNWIDYLASIDIGELQSETTEAQIRDKLSDHVETASHYQLTSGVIACFHSHIRMWQDMVSKGYRTALIMEDDVDLEWDMDRLVPNAMRALPEDWDIVYLGHCWSQSHASELQP